MTFLVCVAGSVSTPARPTSEPVSGGGRHRDDRRDAGRVGTRPPVADIFEIPDRSLLAGHEADKLAHVERAAAAEGDHTVMPTGAERIQPPGEIRRDGIRLHVAEQRGRQPGRAQDRQRASGDRLTRQATVGDE